MEGARLISRQFSSVLISTLSYYCMEDCMVDYERINYKTEESLRPCATDHSCSSNLAVGSEARTPRARHIVGSEIEVPNM